MKKFLIKLLYPDKTIRRWYRLSLLIKNPLYPSPLTAIPPPLSHTKDIMKYFHFRKYTLGGSYRKIIQVPLNLTWKIIHYNEPNEDLVASDIDEVRAVQSFKNAPGKTFKKYFSSYTTLLVRIVHSRSKIILNLKNLSYKYSLKPVWKFMKVPIHFFISVNFNSSAPRMLQGSNLKK